MKKLSKWDNRFLNLAEYASYWSKDPSTQCGAVIARGNRVISMGFNGFPKGTDDAPARYQDREQKYLRVVHAEVNAILFSRCDLTGCTSVVDISKPTPKRIHFLANSRAGTGGSHTPGATKKRAW